MGRHHHARSLPRRQQQPAGQIGRGPNLAPKHPHAYAAATAGQAPGHATPPTQRRRSARRSRGPPGSAATAAAPEAEPSPPGAVAVVERRRAREREAPPPPSAARASPGGFLRRRRGRGAGERGWRRGGLGFPRVASQATRGYAGVHPNTSGCSGLRLFLMGGRGGIQCGGAWALRVIQAASCSCTSVTPLSSSSSILPSGHLVTS